MNSYGSRFQETPDVFLHLLPVPDMPYNLFINGLSLAQHLACTLQSRQSLPKELIYQPIPLGNDSC